MANPVAAIYNNAQVTNATNPTNFGYHHGPIPNNNVGWVPPARAARLAARLGSDQVTAFENSLAPNLAVGLSSFNTGVCDIAVNGGQLCGVVFQSRVQQPGLRRHIRNEHPGALINPTRQKISITETIAGQNALKLYVRSGGWRNQQYVREPGRGPIDGILETYATEMEEIARSDTDFTATYGTQSHRHDIPNPRKRQLAPSLVHAEPASISLSDSATNAQPSSARTERTVKKELERDVDISNPESFDEERTWEHSPASIKRSKSPTPEAYNPRSSAKRSKTTTATQRRRSSRLAGGGFAS